MISVDKTTIKQILASLMKNPFYLSEKDKYTLSPNDFPNLFERYIYSAIFNLYTNGATSLTEVDIYNYFEMYPNAKVIFEKNNGIEYLQDALKYSKEDNFAFYYQRLKKINALNDLEKIGYDVSKYYCDDLLNPKAKEINDNFERLEIKEIFEDVKKTVMKVETKYHTGDASITTSVSEGITELLENLKVKPEIGAPLQGDIFNTICRGARKTKFYIRSASSGAGKTRSSVGDACYISYPVRFNPINWMWEWTGSQEKTLFIATEQDREEIQTLVLAYLTGFPEEKFLYYDFSELEMEIVKQALEVLEVYKDNLIFVTLPNPSIEQIKSVVRQNWILYDIQNVFYDYIFSSPSLLNEFRDLRIREDVALGMLSTALKDLAVELKIFVMSSTQTNAKGDEAKGLKDESIVRGSRAIIDKCDIACVISRVSEDDITMLSDIIDQIGISPTHVTDIYKVRRGKYNKVKVWSNLDLGTCRKTDLFITDEQYRSVTDFKTVKFMFDEDNNDNVLEILNKLNHSSSVTGEITSAPEPKEENNEINIANIESEESLNNCSLFSGLL